MIGELYFQGSSSSRGCQGDWWQGVPGKLVSILVCIMLYFDAMVFTPKFLYAELIRLSWDMRELNVYGGTGNWSSIRKPKQSLHLLFDDNKEQIWVPLDRRQDIISQFIDFSPMSFLGSRQISRQFSISILQVCCVVQFKIKWEFKGTWKVFYDINI